MATNHSPLPKPALIAGTFGAGLALTVTGYLYVQPPQTVDHLPVSASVMQEDDEGFDCHLMGNRVCGDPGQVHAAEAWQAWDTAGGWTYLRVNPDVENRVDYIGTATLPPSVDTSAGYGAIPSLNGWYVFRAVPVDAAATVNGEG